MLWTISCCSSDFVASGFQFAHRRKSDPLAAGCGVGGSGHQLIERTPKRGLKFEERLTSPARGGRKQDPPRSPPVHRSPSRWR